MLNNYLLSNYGIKNEFIYRLFCYDLIIEDLIGFINKVEFSAIQTSKKNFKPQF